MTAVPVIINGVFMPKGKGAGDKPEPGVFIGYATIAGLQVGGGPVIPDTGPVPPDPPIDVPPPDNPPPNVVVLIKPAPVTGGWGLATDNSGQFQWYFVPSGSQPKR